MFLACSTRTMANARQIVREAPEPRYAPPRLVEARKPVRVAPCRPTPSQRPILTPSDKVRRVIDLVARMHGATFAEVVGRSRSARITPARFAAISAVAAFRPNYKNPQIGRYFQRDPTSILNALHVWKTGRTKPRYGKALRKWEGRK